MGTHVTDVSIPGISDAGSTIHRGAQNLSVSMV